MSFSSICATITLLRSPNASSPHLVSGSLLLPPFTQRSPRNSVEKNVNRLPQLIPRRRIGLCRFPRFVSKSWQDDAHGQLVSSTLSFSSICATIVNVTPPQRFREKHTPAVVFLDLFPKVGRRVTPLAWHTPEKTDRRVELGRFSRFSKLIPRRRIGLCRFARFVQLSPC